MKKGAVLSFGEFTDLNNRWLRDTFISFDQITVESMIKVLKSVASKKIIRVFPEYF